MIDHFVAAGSIVHPFAILDPSAIDASRFDEFSGCIIDSAKIKSSTGDGKERKWIQERTLKKKKGKIEKRKEKDKGEEREETKLIGVVSHWVVAVGDDAKS